MKHLFILISFFLVFSVWGTAQTSWTLLNPPPTFHTGADVHFVSNERGFVLADRLILRTIDAGANWAITDTMPPGVWLADIEFLDTLGIIVGRFGYVLRSTDTGDSWTKIPTGIFGQDYHSAHILTPDTIIVSSAEKLVKSYDGGESWEALNIPHVARQTYFQTATTGHAACEDGIMLKTTDGGLSWYVTASSTSVPSDFVNIHFINDSVGYASREHSELYRTEDGGESWIDVSFSSDLLHSMTFIDENVGYTAGDLGALFKTVDGGTTWEWVSFQDSRINFTDIFGLHFLDAQTGYAVGQRGRITKTTDGGASWTDYAFSYEDIDQIEFPADYLGFALIRDKMYRTEDGGFNWINLGAPIPDEKISAFDFVNEQVGYLIAGGQIGTSADSEYIYKTTDGGTTWTATNNGNYLEWLTDLLSIDFVNPSVGFASGERAQSDAVFKTTNGGNSWTKIADHAFVQMQFVSAEEGYGRKYFQKKLYKTTDGGQSWEVILEADEIITQFAIADTGLMYVCGRDGLLLRTQDAGLNWEPLQQVPNDDYVVLAFADAALGYLVDDNGNVHRTEDGGLNWTFVIKIAKVTDISFSDQHIYLAGTYGKLLSTILSPISSTTTVPADPVEISLTPNPTSGHFMVYSHTDDPITAVNVYDLNGREINCTQSRHGHYEMGIRLPVQASGVYLVQVTIGNQYRISQKIVVH